MKFMRHQAHALLVSLPFAGIAHIVLSLCLLGLHVGGRAAYLIGDMAILAAWAACMVALSPRLMPSLRPTPAPSLTGLSSTTPRLVDRAKKALPGIAVCLSILMLWSVRLDYAGPAYDGSIVIDATDARTALPIFSDEWLMSGFAKKTMEKRTLPIFDPLKREFEHRDNFLAPLISGIAGLSISLGIDPVRSYWIFVFAFQAAFASIFYFFLRTFRLSTFSAALGTVLLICLPESNLAPGIWVMLPAYVGLAFLIAGLALGQAEWPIAHSSVRMRRSGIAANLALASIVYPPYLILIAIYLFVTNRKSPERLAWFAAIAAVGIFFIIKSTGMKFGLNTLLPLAETVWRMAVHERFASSTPAIWKFIPAAFFLTASIGYAVILKRGDLSASHKRVVGLGVPFFGTLAIVTYAFDKEVLLSHQRSVFIFWLLMIVATCAFVDRFSQVALKKIARFRSRDVEALVSRAASPSAIVPHIALIGLISVQAAMLALGAYQDLPPWRGVVADVDPIIGPIASRPIMLRMLPDEYAERVAPLGSLRFIADPYVSLALGATTGLEPVSATPSFMSISGPTLADLRDAGTCADKIEFAKRQGISLLIAHVSDLSIASCATPLSGMRLRSDIDLGDRYSLYQI